MTSKNILHIRRCHVCGSVSTTVNSYNQACDFCGKYFAPFYFFQEGQASGYGDTELVWSYWKLKEGFHPLLGFSTYWEAPEEAS